MKRIRILWRITAMTLATILMVGALAPTTLAAPNATSLERQRVVNRVANDLRSIDVPEEDVSIQRLKELWWLANENRWPSSGNSTTGYSYGNGGYGGYGSNGGYGNNSGYGNYGGGNYSYSTGGNNLWGTSNDGYNLWSGPINVTLGDAFEQDAYILARIMYYYGRNVWSETRQAAIAWVVLNNMDISGNTRVSADAVQCRFSAANVQFPYDDWGREMVVLARDVLYRHELEKTARFSGSLGRVIPNNYYALIGTGPNLQFRTSAAQSGTQTWNFSYNTPYGT